MTEPRIVYAVTAGEYSDYRVKALFEREEDAVAAVRSGLGDDTAEFRYYPAGAELPRKVGYWMASVNVTPTGDMVDHFSKPLESPQTWPRDDWTSDTDFTPPKRPNVTVMPLSWAKGRAHQVRVEAMTEDAAIKACADTVAKLRAEILEREALKPEPGQKPERRRG